MTRMVSGAMTTSWKPAVMWPPVSHSSCLPAWSRRQPSGTTTLYFLPLRSQMYRPGKRDLPAQDSEIVMGDRSEGMSGNERSRTVDGHEVEVVVEAGEDGALLLVLEEVRAGGREEVRTVLHAASERYGWRHQIDCR